jgi:3-oxoadipate enol-lactonase
MQPEIITRHGCALHYWVAGSDENPVLLLIHGAGVDHELWRPNVPALADDHRVIACDVRGHGLSRPMGAPFTLATVLDDLLAVLDAVGARDAVVIGQSMGGNLAQELVRHHPERIRGLVLTDCACNTARLSALERFGVWLTPALLKLYPREVLLKQSANAISIRGEVRDYVYAAMKKLSKEDIVAVMQATLGCIRDDPDYRIGKPFILVRGALSRAGSIARQGPAWARREPQCRADVVIPNAGHCVNLEEPARFNAAVRDFLRSL